jgi:hypothetical protein
MKASSLFLRCFYRLEMEEFCVADSGKGFSKKKDLAGLIRSAVFKIGP